MQQTFEITITGQVQGVGFRPFVYRAARERNLKGTVRNTGKGVVIRVNGNERTIMEFLNHIVEKAPEVAVVHSRNVHAIAAMEFSDFTIEMATVSNKIAVPLTADFAICSACQEEIKDPKNRRYGYAFTTCTQCGPRYAITTLFPFERHHTSLKSYSMCPECHQEYTDADDGRFHSQTNSCEQCGIKLQLQKPNGEEVKIPQEESMIDRVAALLLNGNILAIKNTNGYLLCVDAQNETAIARLRERKQRPTKPFALLYPSIEQIQEDFEVNESEKNALTSAIGPITLLEPKQKAHKLAENIAPDLGNYGVMLSSSALLTLLMNKLKKPIVATSGNIHGSPILATNAEAMDQLRGVADYFLNHDLHISFPQDDSVIRYADQERIILRRSRGLAPNFLRYRPRSNQQILAMGAHLKSTFAFVPNGYTYISQYFGNLDNFEVLQRYTEILQRYTQLFDTLPKVILVDQHPNYQSTQLGKEIAQKWQVPCVSIQHHKAHFASVLAEHDLLDTQENVLGVVWDGTGYGDDGMIWGGEFFNYQQGVMKRVAHFGYFDSLAGDKMAKEPRLSLFSLTHGKALSGLKHKFSDMEWKLYLNLKNKNVLKTSSVGRLFDAVACLLGLQDISTYEGEAAMRLEHCAESCANEDYLNLCEETYSETIPTQKIVQHLWELKVQGVSVPLLAASFIHTLAMIIIKMAKQQQVRVVACSGGVFQNAFLVKQLSKLAQKEGLTIKYHQELSSNDENIALGQLAYYENCKL